MAHDVGAFAVLGYRGPLLHWVASRTVAGRGRLRIRGLVAAGYLAALTGLVVSAVATAAVAAGLAAVVLQAAPRNVTARRNAWADAAALVLLAALWAGSAFQLLPGTAAAATPIPVCWQLAGAPGIAGRNDAVGGLVLELGPSDRPASPVRASLARALADPELEVRTFQPDTGWTDELGRPAADPATFDSARTLTQVDTPDGGRVVLVHGARGPGDAELAPAAARAAALALESVRVEAQARRQAGEVRRSAARLMTVEHAERQALADRLRGGAIARLDRVRREALRADATPVVAELDHVIADLDRLARGLNPAAISGHPLGEALPDLAARSGLAHTLELDGDLAALPEDAAALAYFVAAECLTNITRHAHATWANVRVRAGRTLTVEITDNGRGGATAAAGRGLQGLADRIAVAGGTFAIDSPPGGPTRITAEIPCQ